MSVSPEQERQTDIVSTAANSVVAYVSSNPLPVGESPKLIGDIRMALRAIGTPATEFVVKQEPAVSTRKSVTPDYIIRLEEEKQFKSLKPSCNSLQHQSARPPSEMELALGLSFSGTNYAATRPALAKTSRLGRKTETSVPLVAAEKPRRAARVAAATRTQRHSTPRPRGQVRSRLSIR